MSLARAEFKIGNKSQKTSVMIERPSLRDSGGSKSAETSDLVTVAEYLAHHLIASNATAGMLPCLGYRLKQKLELIFQIPPGLELGPRCVARSSCWPQAHLLTYIDSSIADRQIQDEVNFFKGCILKPDEMLARNRRGGENEYPRPSLY